MVFSSLLFVFAFLTPCLLIYTFIDQKYKNRVLLIFSLVFYAWGGIAFVGILVADAAICWICALQIETGERKTQALYDPGLYRTAGIFGRF